MEKKLYYVVHKETENVGGFEESTGWKTIYVYTIENNTPELWFDVEVSNEESSEEAIDEWLIDNGYGDVFIEKINL